MDLENLAGDVVEFQWTQRGYNRFWLLQYGRGFDYNKQRYVGIGRFLYVDEVFNYEWDIVSLSFSSLHVQNVIEVNEKYIICGELRDRNSSGKGPAMFLVNEEPLEEMREWWEDDW